MLLGGGGGVVEHVSASVLRDLRSPDLAWIGPVREFRQRILALLPADQVPAAKGLHIAALPIGRKRPVRSRLGHDYGIREVSVVHGVLEAAGWARAGGAGRTVRGCGR